MQKFVLISRGGTNIVLVNRLRFDLMRKGFPILNADALIQGSEVWWQHFKQDLETSPALIVMMVPSTKTSAHVQREIKLALAAGVRIIPLLFEGDKESSIPEELVTTEWIDVSTKDKYEAGLDVLFEDLFNAFGIDPTWNHQAIQKEIQQITVHIPNIRKIRLVQLDGLVHPIYRYDAGHHKRDTELDIEEDRLGAMSAASISLSERIGAELMLGASRLVVIAGENASHFVLPIGDSMEWVISLIIGGHPSVDEITKYFKDRENLAHIIPMLESLP